MMYINKVSPLISVVMPSYNGADHIKETIEGILAQTYGNFELIIVNDGSTDSTEEIVRLYQKEDSRIRLISQSNCGCSEARYKGIKEANGEYTILTDDDDVWNQLLLEDSIKNIEGDPLLDGVCNFYFVDSSSDFSETVLPSFNDSFSIYNNIKNCSGLEIQRLALDGDSVYDFKLALSWGVLVKTSLWKALAEKLHDEFSSSIPKNYLDDMMYVSRLFSKENRFSIVKKVYIHYRYDIDSISHKLRLNDYNRHSARVGDVVANYYRTAGDEKLYQYNLLGTYLWIVRTDILELFYERDRTIRKNNRIELKTIYDKYIADFRHFSYEGKDKVFKQMILAWRRIPLLLGLMVKIVKRW